MRKIRMYVWVGLTALLCLVLPVYGFAATATTTLTTASAPDVFVTELQTTGGTASEEFLEFYNSTDQDVDFADTGNSGKDVWKLQFYGSTATASGNPDWTKPTATLGLTGTIAAHSYYLLSSAQTVNGAATTYKPGGLDPDQTYGPRLSDTGGGVQLVDVSGSVITAHDRVLWKQIASGQMLPAGMVPAPPAGQSLQRLPNSDVEYLQSDGSLMPLQVEEQISPADAWQPPEILPTPDAEDDNTDAPADDTDTSPSSADDPAADDSAEADTTDPATLLPPQFTELLPNPASPLTDAQDEFIELYNPNADAFNLKGYTLETGTTVLHDFTFGSDTLLPPLSYMAFYSADTHLSLSNAGGQVRLLDAGEVKLAETTAYTAAADGMAWDFWAGTWQWSTTPTPGGANVLTQPVTVAKTTAAAKPKAKATVTKKTTGKVKGATTTKTVKAKKPKTTGTATKSSAADATTAASVTPLHSWTLAAVAGAALLYGAYEYRHDLANHFYQRKRDRAARREAGA